MFSEPILHECVSVCLRASVEAYFVSVPLVFTQTSLPNFKILVE